MTPVVQKLRPESRGPESLPVGLWLPATRQKRAEPGLRGWVPRAARISRSRRGRCKLWPWGVAKVNNGRAGRPG